MLTVGAQDAVTPVNVAINRLTELVRSTPRPAGSYLLWGDISNGSYLQSLSTEIRAYGTINFTLAQTRNLCLEDAKDFPATTRSGHVLVKDDVPYIYLNGDWTAFGVVSAFSVSSAGAVMATDYGMTKGAFPVANGAGSFVLRTPGTNGSLLVAASGEATGWLVRTAAQVVAGTMGAKGDLLTRNASGTLVALGVGADDELLVGRSSASGGLAWATFASRLQTQFSARGNMLVATGAGTYAELPAPTSNTQVLVGNAAAPTKMRWAEQSELGAVPGERTRAAADMFMYLNFI